MLRTHAIRERGIQQLSRKGRKGTINLVYVKSDGELHPTANTYSRALAVPEDRVDHEDIGYDEWDHRLYNPHNEAYDDRLRESGVIAADSGTHEYIDPNPAGNIERLIAQGLYERLDAPRRRSLRGQVASDPWARTPIYGYLPPEYLKISDIERTRRRDPVTYQAYLTHRADVLLSTYFETLYRGYFELYLAQHLIPLTFPQWMKALLNERNPDCKVRLGESDGLPKNLYTTHGPRTYVATPRGLKVKVLKDDTYDIKVTPSDYVPPPSVVRLNRYGDELPTSTTTGDHDAIPFQVTQTLRLRVQATTTHASARPDLRHTGSAPRRVRTPAKALT